jgi:hypothetical protein
MGPSQLCLLQGSPSTAGGVSQCKVHRVRAVAGAQDPVPPEGGVGGRERHQGRAPDSGSTSHLSATMGRSQVEKRPKDKVAVTCSADVPWWTLWFGQE